MCSGQGQREGHDLGSYWCSLSKRLGSFDSPINCSVLLYLSQVLGNNFFKLKILIFGKKTENVFILQMGKPRPRLKYFSKFSQLLNGKVTLRSVIFSLSFTSVSNSNFFQKISCSRIFVSSPRFVCDSFIPFRYQFQGTFREKFPDHST